MDWQCGEEEDDESTPKAKSRLPRNLALAGASLLVAGTGVAVIAGAMGKSAADLPESDTEEFAKAVSDVNPKLFGLFGGGGGSSKPVIASITVDENLDSYRPSDGDVSSIVTGRDEYNRQNPSKKKYLSNEDLVTYGASDSARLNRRLNGLSAQEFAEGLAGEIAPYAENITVGSAADAFLDPDSEIGKMLSDDLKAIIKDRKISPSNIKIVIADEIKVPALRAPHLIKFASGGMTISTPDPNSQLIYVARTKQDSEKYSSSVLNHEAVHCVQKMSGWMFSDKDYEAVKSIVERQKVQVIDRGAKKGLKKTVKGNYNRWVYLPQYWGMEKDMAQQFGVPNHKKEEFVESAKRLEVEAWAIGQGAQPWMLERAKGYNSQGKTVKALR
jgi:hypothetical protein